MYSHFSTFFIHSKCLKGIYYIYSCVYTAYSLPPCWQEGGKSEEWVEFDTPEILNQLFMPGPNHKSPPRYPQVACISNGPIFGEEGAEGGWGGG